eukprot:809015-Lingulodinium_polyedra.AAC.1
MERLGVRSIVASAVPAVPRLSRTEMIQSLIYNSVGAQLFAIRGTASDPPVVCSAAYAALVQERGG